MNIPTTENSREKNYQPPVSFLYIFALTTFSFGTSSINFCAGQALQLTLRHFTDSMALIGLIMSFNALNQLWVTPYVAWKSDRIWTRFGRRRPVVLVMAPILAISIILLPHCPSLWTIMVLVFVLQMAEDAELALMIPSIRDSVPDKQRPLATGTYQFMLAAQIMLFARFVLPLMDRAEHWPYTISGITVIATSLIYLKVMREKYVAPRREKFRFFAYGREILRLREYKLIYIICLFQPLFVLVASVFFATLATETLRLSKGSYGEALSFGSLTTLIVCLPLGYFFSRWRHRKMVCVACCLFALVPITFGLFFMKTMVDFAIFFALRELMFNIYRMNFYPLVLEYTTPKNGATILGFTTAMNGVVRFTMIPLAGFLVDHFGRNYRIPLIGGYLGVAVCLIAFLMMRPVSHVRSLIDESQEA